MHDGEEDPLRIVQSKWMLKQEILGRDCVGEILAPRRTSYWFNKRKIMFFAKSVSIFPAISFLFSEIVD